MFSTLTISIISACLIAAMAGLCLFAWLAKVPINYNLRNLFVRWQVTLLMLTAFTMQIGVLIFMFAFVNGMYKLTQDSGVPGNVIVLADGATDEVFSNLSSSDIADIERHPNVLQSTDPADPGPLASWEVYILVNQPIPPERINAVKLSCQFEGESMAIVSTEWGGFAQSAGIRAGDTLTRFEGIPVNNHESLQKLLAGKLEGNAKLEVSRGTSVVNLTGELGRVVATGSTRRFLQVRGIDNPARSLAVHNISLHTGGEVFSQAGVRTVKLANQPGGEVSAWEVVLGEGIARTLGKDRQKEILAPGDLFSVADRHWVVAGVMKSSGSTFDSEIWAKRQLVGPIFGKINYSTLVIRTSDAATAKETAEDLAANYKTSAVGAKTEKDYYAGLSATNEQFLYSIFVVGVVVLIGGSLGMMNAMFAAISQRIKDIGVLRIIGFQPWQILCCFLMEALLLAFLGGLLGCAVGMLADGWSANSIVSGGQGGGKSVVLKMTVDYQLLLMGMLCSMTVGLIGGLVPAITAMFVKPLDALR